MEFSQDATFYCPICGEKMTNLRPPSHDLCVTRCILCAQTWEITFNADAQPVLTAIGGYKRI